MITQYRRSVLRALRRGAYPGTSPCERGANARFPDSVTSGDLHSLFQSQEGLQAHTKKSVA